MTVRCCGWLRRWIAGWEGDEGGREGLSQRRGWGRMPRVATTKTTKTTAAATDSLVVTAVTAAPGRYGCRCRCRAKTVSGRWARGRGEEGRDRRRQFAWRGGRRLRRRLAGHGGLCSLSCLRPSKIDSEISIGTKAMTLAVL
jgi:hypothetical protein